MLCTCVRWCRSLCVWLLCVFVVSYGRGCQHSCVPLLGHA
nr:MAG TPA: hypothetical protein [Caudoviricetes sp.]